MPDYSLFPATKGNQFSFNDFRTALDVGNNQPISFADLYPGGVYIPDNNNFFTQTIIFLKVSRRYSSTATIMFLDIISRF